MRSAAPKRTHAWRRQPTSAKWPRQKGQRAGAVAVMAVASSVVQAAAVQAGSSEEVSACSTNMQHGRHQCVHTAVQSCAWFSNAAQQHGHVVLGAVRHTAGSGARGHCQDRGRMQGMVKGAGHHCRMHVLRTTVTIACCMMRIALHRAVLGTMTAQ